ncbi:MAG: nuclear transport factor 2 family protein [Bacteroidota bacterium]
MKPFIILGCLCICFLGIRCTEPAVQEEETVQITQEEVDALLKKWERAIIEKDPELFAEVLDDEYIYSGGGDGSTVSKEAMLAEITNDESEFISQELFDVQTSFYEDIVIVRGWEIITLIPKGGEQVEVKLRFTDVYRKKDGVLKALSTHSSPIFEQGE